MLCDAGGPSIVSLSFDSGFYALSFETLGLELELELGLADVVQPGLVSGHLILHRHVPQHLLRSRVRK